MVYIAYFTELILQICDYAQKRRIQRENCKYALDENFHCSRRKAAKFCHPGEHGNCDKSMLGRKITCEIFGLNYNHCLHFIRDEH